MSWLRWGSDAGCLTGRTCSMLVDAAAHDHVVEALAVHLFRLVLARHRIGELVFLPERRLLLRQLNALFDEELAVDVPQLDQVAPDLLLVEAVREYGPVRSEE